MGYYENCLWETITIQKSNFPQLCEWSKPPEALCWGQENRAHASAVFANMQTLSMAHLPQLRSAVVAPQWGTLTHWVCQFLQGCFWCLQVPRYLCNPSSVLITPAEKLGLLPIRHVDRVPWVQLINLIPERYLLSFEFLTSLLRCRKYIRQLINWGADSSPRL